MCTVTFIPLNNENFILTSNRDVGYSRQKAEPPMRYLDNGVELFYPKDGKAGGTWIGASSRRRALCILNGGFKNHSSVGNYRASRGEVVIDLLKEVKIEKGIKGINLNNIEPFTLVIMDWQKELKLMELIWDGDRKHFNVLPLEMHIWSSSTLFDKEMKKMRDKWFLEWQRGNKIDQTSILEFHHIAGIGDSNVDVILRREKVGTVSITSLKKEDEHIDIIYEELGL